MMQRATVAADSNDLAVLADEARRRGTSLARLLGEAVAHEAERLRRSRTPRVGTFRAEAAVAAAMADDPDGPAAAAYR